MKRRCLVSAFLVVVLLLGVAGCGGGAQQKPAAAPAAPKKVLTVPMTADPGTADVQMTTSEYTIPLNVYDTLVEAVTVGPGQSKIQPALAEKYEVSADGMTYTFFLKKGVLFHNGQELTADDVVFTFDRMLDPATKALNTDFLDMIQGAKERMEGKATSTAGLKAVDKYTVELKLSTPFAPFIAGLATPGCAIYNKKAVTELGEKYALNPVGTGPFKFKSWKYNDEIVFDAYDKYFRGPAKFDQLVFKIIPDIETQRMKFEKGELDIFDCDLAPSKIQYFTTSDKFKNWIVSGPRVGTYYFALNTAMKPLNDVRVRKAIQYAIDRKTIIDKIYNGTGIPAGSVMAPGLAGYNPNLPGFTYDPEKAKTLLKEAGYPNGFSMEIWQGVTWQTQLKINEVVQAMLAQVGIKATIKQVDDAVYLSTRKEGKVPMYGTSWSADFNDPDNFLYTFFAPANSKARSFNYNNKRVQDILEQCRKITNMEERYKLYQEAEKLAVYDDAVWVPLFHLNHLFVVQPRVKNFKVSWNGWSSMSYYGIAIEEPATK